MSRVLGQPSAALGGPPPTPPKKQQPLTLRAFGDAPATRKAIFDNALTAAQEMEPTENQRHILRLKDVEYAGPESYRLKDEKQALLTGQTLSRKLRGTWELVDKATGEVLDQSKQTIAHIPWWTPRGTTVHGGSDLALINQQRLRPGVYSRIKDNGEIEAHANILPGKGPSHRYHLDPDKGIFYLNIEQSKIPIMPLMRALGAKDSQLMEAWGPKLYQANMQTDNPANLNKLVAKLARKLDPNADDREKHDTLRAAFEKMELDPKVSQRTLGKPHAHMGLEPILDTTRKLLAISRGETEVDDRDHLANQTVHGPEDLISERLRRDYGGVRRKLLMQASFAGNLSRVPVNALNRQVEAALLHSGLGQHLEEVNPADLLDKQARISRLGEGGIPSMDAVPDEARSVQPSHFGFMDPLRTPESFKVGVDIQIARGAKKGSDGKLYSQFVNPQTGKAVLRSPEDVADLAVAFPGEMEQPGKRVRAIQGGQMHYVRKDQVDLVLPSMEHGMSSLSNMIPMKMMTKGQRVAMGSRYLTQALPVADPEAPWVQSGIPETPGRSFEEEYGKHMGALHFNGSGPARVLSVDADGVTLQHADGAKETLDLYNNFPFNRKTYIHQTAVVKPGDRVEPGQLLAHSNFTDKTGTTALGKNAYVAYLPFKGLNTKDAVVISESFSKRMSSEHMYQHAMEYTEDHKPGKRPYLSLFPGKFNREQVATLDNQGVVKPGTTLNYGDPLVVAAQQRAEGYNRVHKKGARGWADASLTWKHESPGVVTDVVMGKHGPTVLVKSVFTTQVGDKLSGRYGDKGVISSIVPDDQMPHDTRGKPFEILVNPTGIISRTNPSQVMEAVLGKIVAKTGQPYKIPDFQNHGQMTQFVLNELRQHNVPFREAAVDPATGRKITGEDGQGILVGMRHYMKLHHTAEGKGQSRGTGGYTQQGEPSKGGEAGSKRLAMMDTNALLAHGATQVLRDASLIKGQANPEYWMQWMQGNVPPDPTVPKVYTKFINELKSAGINVVNEGHKTHIMALTDKDVDQLTEGREIQFGHTVHWDKRLKPVAGGLFDETLTGGHNGNRWAHVKLDEPLPNPVMEEPIRRILGVTEKQFRGVLAGSEHLGNWGTGPQALQRALEAVNIPKAIAAARAQVAGGRATIRDQAVRKLGYLKSADALGIHPSEWLLNKVPVLPPTFRPVSLMQNNMPLVADANYLYKELIEARDNLREMKKSVSDVGAERLALYDSFKAVTGLGDPLHPKLQEKQVGGVLKHIFGSSPKYGTVQRRLLSSAVDLVGRAAITPNPDLDMDQVGLPEPRAWDLYKMFIVRRLKRRGLPLGEAARNVREHTPLAREELDKELDERPVYIDRAPVLHKFGIMAFHPVLSKNHTLQVSPMICKGFNADFDGDAMNYHVPVGPEAVKEALERMLPSKNLISPTDFKTPVHFPEEEYIGGLFSATRPPKEGKRPAYFHSKQDAINAYMHGEIGVNDPVVIQK